MYKLKPRFKFWNPFYPPTYLRPSSDINAKKWMIEQPLSKFKSVWRKAAHFLFNFRIGRISVITNDFDSGIKRYEYND